MQSPENFGNSRDMNAFHRFIAIMAGHNNNFVTCARQRLTDLREDTWVKDKVRGGQLNYACGSAFSHGPPASCIESSDSPSRRVRSPELRCGLPSPVVEIPTAPTPAQTSRSASKDDASIL